ncbi:MAG: putative DNA base hypermodification protein [Actinomycetota bacterium]|nr:putative DNA base hypermodification protein [Actinomycetota bacterium]MDA3013375.1 putative DNA base hypermodification protein [Actinomycetota bacterium]
MSLENPYKKSLDGLEIKDPVKSFFDYCKERESIRLKRESGETFPWSEDSIFQKGRFLNVFREDDKVSRSIINIGSQIKDDVALLVQFLFFARWCNKNEVIQNLKLDELNNPDLLKNKLYQIGDWANLTAYPVEDITWKDVNYERIDAATLLFYNIREVLLEIITLSEKSVVKATESINEKFKMKNNFPIFMALIDIAWFRPELIPLTSDVPTGIGASPYLDRLQKHLGLNSHQQVATKMITLQEEYWPSAKRTFYPIDIEYQSCECRKYFSYVNGTKKFEGKNLFSV